ncbi:MAG: CPBP family intramembrane metalloprotease [Spirochaetes bacterium]|nr:CPBP family intramembrane metalloprotease [Spirochaetota bacterium]
MANTIILVILLAISAAGFYFSGNYKDKTIGIWDILFILAFWNAFDTGWFFILDWTRQSEPDMLSHPYMISAIPFALVLLAYIHRRGIDLGPSWRKGLLTVPKFYNGIRDLRILSLFIIAVFIILPVAYAIGFVSWSPDLRFARMPIRFIEYLFLVGFVEELVFRGVIQNLLVDSFVFKGGRVVAFILANLLFALMWTHSGVPQWFNAEYVALAFLTGLFYGGVYLKSGNLWTAAFLHGFVDFFWVTFLSGQG